MAIDAVVTEKKLIVAASPHLHSLDSIHKVMRDVIIALLPAVGAAVYFFRFPALIVLFVAVASSLLIEYGWLKLTKGRGAINDLSAVVTGLLLALTLPPATPWWMVVIGSAVAVLLGKQVFGGLGHNPFNPALIGRAFLQISWPQALNSWVSPFDAVSSATPLAIKKLGLSGELPSLMELFIGKCSGSLGETSVLALLIGGLYLIKRKHIFPIVPFIYIGTVMAGALLTGQNALFHAFSGGLMLGAFFMATDPVTSPISEFGKMIFAFGCGLLTITIRLKGGFPEGVCFSILIMNMLVPLIDKYTILKPFGAKS